MSRLSIEEQTVLYWEVDILAKLERAREILTITLHCSRIKGVIIKSKTGSLMEIKCGEEICLICNKYQPDCSGCPLAITKPACEDTPYQNFRNKMVSRDLPSAIKEARNMIAFMKNRFKEVERKLL